MQKMTFSTLLANIKTCTLCAEHLAVLPKPVVQLHPRAKILVIAQAPGTRARASGRPFDDASGDRLRRWLAVEKTIFYDPNQFAFMPMGFCYPGKSQGGDLPPCKDCAPIWHPQIMPYLTNISLTLLVGTYAHRYYLQTSSVTNTVINWQSYLPRFLPLPHPSWHNNAWIKKNPWFEICLVPHLQQLVQTILSHS